MLQGGVHPHMQGSIGILFGLSPNMRHTSFDALSQAFLPPAEFEAVLPCRSALNYHTVPDSY
jgi:hypothetical protein